MRPTHRLWSVGAQKTIQYEVELVDDLLEHGHPLLTPGGQGRRFVVIDATVAALYGDAIRRQFERAGMRCELFPLSCGEESKTIEQVSAVVHAIDAFGIDRRHEPIVAIGGGVVLDMAGLAASLYRRGTPYIRVPTTLIGLVDAGVGVKTAVNHGWHKNRLGSYFAPCAVLLDRRFLATLDTRHIANGLAEILKMALIADAELFELLEGHGPLLLEEKLQGHSPLGDATAMDALERAITGMLEELRPNLWEKQLDRLVDYGHSIGPTIEMMALPELLHGETVAIDMALFTAVALRRGTVSDRDAERVYRTMQTLGLPIWHPLLTRAVLGGALADTVLHRGGLQRLPLPLGVGAAAFVNDVTEDELCAAADSLRERVAAHV